MLVQILLDKTKIYCKVENILRTGFYETKTEFEILILKIFVLTERKCRFIRARPDPRVADVAVFTAVALEAATFRCRGLWRDLEDGFTTLELSETFVEVVWRH